MPLKAISNNLNDAKTYRIRKLANERAKSTGHNKKLRDCRILIIPMKKMNYAKLLFYYRGDSASGYNKARNPKHKLCSHYRVNLYCYGLTKKLFIKMKI